MLGNLLAGFLVKSLLKAQEEVVEAAAKEVKILQLRERARKYFLAHISKTFMEEAAYNYGEYAKSIQKSEVEIEISKIETESLRMRFENSMYDFQRIFENTYEQSVPVKALEKSLGLSEPYYLSKPQKNPVLAYINKEIASPGSYQPFLLRETDSDSLLKTINSIFDEVFSKNFATNI